jgi:hypothetical protein
VLLEVLEGGGKQLMKRIRMLVLAGAIAVALPFGMSSVGATGSGSSVYIQDQVDYNIAGTQLDVGLQVRCKTPSGLGTVRVQVDQEPPYTPYPVGTGSGPQSVVCDNVTRAVGVTIVGFGFDAGRATATAMLTTPGNPNGNKTVVKDVTIVVV